MASDLPEQREGIDAVRPPPSPARFGGRVLAQQRERFPGPSVDVGPWGGYRGRWMMQGTSDFTIAFG